MLALLGITGVGGWLRAGAVLAVLAAVAAGYLSLSRLTTTIAVQAAAIAARDAEIKARDGLLQESARETIRAADAQARTALALRQVRADHAATLETLAHVRATADQQRARLEKLKQEITRAPNSDDGPLAPVFRKTLDAVRGGDAVGVRITPRFGGPTGPAADTPDR
jgi:hypothetical protein